MAARRVTWTREPHGSEALSENLQTKRSPGFYFVYLTPVSGQASGYPGFLSGCD